jgi:hypothetical protein
MDKIEELTKLKELLDNGIISHEEFDSLKNEILNSKQDKLADIIPIDSIKTENNNKPQSGVLTINYKGKWFLLDAKTTLKINGEVHSKHSTKKGFSVEIPIESESIKLGLAIGGMKTTTYDLKELKKGCDYNLELIYDDVWGKYSNKFNMSENVKNIE